MSCCCWARGIADGTMNCLRAFSSGYQFRFDILMDIGGFRDMHRHRRCVQTMQSFTNAHGYEVPELLAEIRSAPAV